MKKKDLIKRVADKCDYSQRQVEEMYDVLKDVVEDAIAGGEEFKLLGFIKIGTKKLSPRKGKMTNRFGEVVEWERTEEITVPTVGLTKYITKRFKE